MKAKSVCLILVSIIIGGGVVLMREAWGLTYQNNVNIGFTFTPTVTVSLSGDSGTNLVIDNLAPGNAADSNIITVTAGTNSGTGFNLTASAGSTDSSSAYYNSNALQNGSSTISSLASTAANLDAITAGQWGYSYSVDSGTNWVSGSTGSTSTGYAGLPAVNSTAVTLASSNSNASSSVQFKIAAKADTNQVSGTYSNVVNFIATAKPITTNYTITYYDGDTAMSTPAPVVGTISSGNTFSLPLNSDASKSGYTLKGWCYGTLVSDTCNGTIYQPGETYLVGNIGGTATINLVAIWKSTGPSFLAMQDVATWGGSLSIGDEVTATDIRDGKEYTVARLADGNIWMTQNLDHDIKTDGSVTYDSTTTDIPSAWTPSTATYATGSTTWNSSTTAPESYDPGDLCWNVTLGSYNLSTGTTTCTSENMHYHIGNYYNWTAAVAMNDSSSYTTQNTDVNQSICPAGWMLPKSGTTLTGSGSFYNLVNGRYTAGTSGNIQNSPVYFVYGGYWRGSSFGVGRDGYYWSSVVYDANSAYDLYFSRDGDWSSRNDDYRYYGYSVRCVARDREFFMQDQTASSLAAMMPNVGDTATLTDKRDGKDYTVAHLADGNYWMTQNLDHDIKTDGSVTYDSTTTDIPSAWTPSTATYATGTTTWNYSTTAPESYDPGDLCWNGALGDYNLSTGTTTCSDDKHMHIGNYYNWTAAVAMNDSSSYTTDNTDVNQSICPAGWRLPIGGTSNTGSKSFQYLVDQLSLTSGTSGNIQNSPVYFVYGGYWSGSSYGVGSDGAYWSSVVSDGDYAYVPYFSRYGSLDPQDFSGRDLGVSVRCLAR